MRKKKENLQSLTRKNGRTYTLRDNKDRFLFPEEYQRMEDQLKKKQKHSAIVLVNTGARHMEAYNIKVSDCDLTNNRIILRVTKTKAKKGEKKGRQRIISVSSQFSKYLRKWIRDNKLKDSDYIGVLSNSALNRAYKIAAKKAKIKDYWNIASHTYRKTHGNWLKAFGIDAGEICTRLSHDYNTFLSSYASPDIFTWEDRNKMRDILGDLYRK
jgi:integrase